MCLDGKVTGDTRAHFHLLFTVQVTHPPSKPWLPRHFLMEKRFLGPSQISTTALFWEAKTLTFKFYLVTWLNLFTQHIKAPDIFIAV